MIAKKHFKNYVSDKYYFKIKFHICPLVLLSEITLREDSLSTLVDY